MDTDICWRAKMRLLWEIFCNSSVRSHQSKFSKNLRHSQWPGLEEVIILVSILLGLRNGSWGRRAFAGCYLLSWSSSQVCDKRATGMSPNCHSRLFNFYPAHNNPYRIQPNVFYSTSLNANVEHLFWFPSTWGNILQKLIETFWLLWVPPTKLLLRMEERWLVASPQRINGTVSNHCQIKLRRQERQEYWTESDV